jgi:hypothetical protein
LARIPRPGARQVSDVDGGRIVAERRRDVPGDARVREQVGDGEASAGRAQRRQHGRRPQHGDGAIGPAVRRVDGRLRIPMHLDDGVDEVDDPVLGQSPPRVQTALDPPVEPQARVGDLDHERGHRRVRVDVVAERAADDRDVRLRLGVVVQCERGLQADVPAIAERRPEELADLSDDRGVAAALRFPDDERAVEQLQAFADEDPELHEPLVFRSTPAAGLRVRVDDRRHWPYGSRGPTRRQRSGYDTCRERTSS